MGFRSLKEIRAAIPAELFVRDTRRGLLYFARDVLCAAVCWSLATYIDPYFTSAPAKELLTPIGAEVGRWAAWCVYWWFQGLIFTGIWVIGHEVDISVSSSSAPLMVKTTLSVATVPSPTTKSSMTSSASSPTPRCGRPTSPGEFPTIATTLTTAPWSVTRCMYPRLARI
jgi:hypothetical protein